MRLAKEHKTAVMIGAAGVGALMLAQAWRRREAYDFGRKSVVITGGSRGLGLVMARELADEGARLTLIARNEEELSRAADDIHTRQPFAEVLTIAADVRQRGDAERAIAQTIERYGCIDVLINNAGIIQVGPLDHMQLGDYEDAMATHFWGPLYMIVAALPHMRDQGAGRVVNVSSIGGRIAVPHLVPYSASKFALVGLSDGLRVELARHNITVTTVCPGLMRTGSPVNAMFKGQRPQEYAWFAISDSLPLASIDARRAAHQIIEACRKGDAELVITVQAKLAILARTLAPELFSDVMVLLNRLLPAPAPDGDQSRPGRESESRWAPSKLTEPTYRAAQQNNEM
ncbi:MAG TPA: SDR family NAD(P)-dependent oxidoreductase [Vicinamibacterales bacterium]|nr:SDR family NAD(P)-dependent oxidoreductase [Vicinamibacterales bacterium]